MPTSHSQGQEPPASRPFLPRAGLVGLLTAAPGPLVALVAPAGGGKSMALLAFARAGEEGLCHWTGPDDLALAPQNGTLLIDDLSWPVEPDRQSALMAGLRARLPLQRIFLALNGALPQPLRDEWIAGRATVMTARELAFDPEECAALFGQTPAPRELQQLHQFTRGWPLGLGLLSRDPDAALALMRRDGALQPLPQSLALWFDDWLARAVDDSGRRLLMDLAVFGQFPASLLQALPLPARQGTGGDDLALLRALRDEGLFVCGHDSRADWFSLMPAFARHLRDRLALQDPERATEIRRFAVSWSATHHDAPGELRHGLTVWSRDEALSRVDAAGAIAVSLATGPDIALEQPISAAMAVTAPLTFFSLIYERIRIGAFEEARVHYDNAAALTEGFTCFATTQDSGLIRDWVRVFTAVMRISADAETDAGWRESFGPDLRRAISGDPVLALAQSTVMMLMALNAGATSEALSIARLALHLQEGRADKAAIFVYLHRASALIATARLEDAGAAIAAARALAADHTFADSYEMVSCQIHAGLCAFEAGDAGQAQALLAPCYDHLPHIHGWRRNWLEYFTALAEIAINTKADGGAELWITRGLDLARQRHQPQLKLGLELLRLDLAIREGRADAIAPEFAALLEEPRLDEPVAPQIAHHAQIVRVEFLLQSGRLEEAAASFAGLDRAAITEHDQRLELRVACLGLDLARLRGDADAVLAALPPVLEQVQLFPRIAALPSTQARLGRIADFLLARGRVPDKDMQSLLALAGRSRLRLSPRESQIITMIVEGLSNKEMAQVLGTSEGTVKSHRKNLYEKLDVSSRSRAIARARDLGLVRS